MPFGRVQRLANHARALISGLETVAAQARHMQQHIGGTIIGNDEAEALGDIEPFDGAGDFDQVRRRISSDHPV